MIGPNPFWRAVLGGGGPAPVVDKTAIYSNDFAGIATNATLISQPGWLAYDATGVSANVKKDSMKSDGAGVMRLSVADFDQAPGAVMYGYDTGTLDHAIRVQISSLPVSNRIYLCVGSTNSRNCLYLEWIAGQDRIRLGRNNAGTLTTIFDYYQSTVGVSITATSIIELQVIGQKLHLFIDGTRFTATDGADIGAHVKGQFVGIGSYSNGTVAQQTFYTSIEILPVLAQITAVSAVPFTPTIASSEPVSISGTYQGSIAALQVKTLNADTGATITDWTDAPATISAGTFSAAVTLPKNATAGVRGYTLNVRAKNDTGAVLKTGRAVVGYALLSYGQSNAEYRRDGAIAGITPTPAGNVHTYHFINSGNNLTANPAQYKWYREVDQLKYTAFEDLATAIGTPIGVFLMGIGGQPASALASTATKDIIDSYDSVTRNRWDVTRAQIANGGGIGKIKAILYTQGEQEGSSIGTSVISAYKANVTQVFTDMRSISESTSVPIGIYGIGQYDKTFTATNEPPLQVDRDWWAANWTLVRQYLQQLSTETANAHYSGSFAGVPHSDVYHYDTTTTAGYYEANRRAALSWKKALGLGGYDGRGPFVSGATRSGAVITLAINLNGAASISGTGLTNYEVSTDDFATLKTITSVDVSGGNIVVTLAADPGAAVKVRSYYGYFWGGQSTRVHAMGAYADGTTIPVEPLYSPVTAA